MEQGSSIMKSLFGGGSPGLMGMVSKVTGIGESGTGKLMALIAPLVMSGVAKQFSSQPLNASTLTNFFAGQKSNIAGALPSGFSLSSIPGLSGLSSATSAVASGVQSGYREATNAVGSAASAVGSATQKGYQQTARAASGAKWVLPAVLGVCVVAALLYFAFANWPTEPSVVQTPSVTPTLPDVGKVRTDLTSAISSATDSLSSVRDTATADAALPKLRDAEGKLGTIKGLVDKLPSNTTSPITQFAESNLKPLVDRMNDVLKIPGADEKLRPVMESIAGKVGSLAGASPSQYTLAPPVSPSPPSAREQ